MQEDMKSSHDVSCVVFVLHKGVVQPDELLMLSDHGELILLEVSERALWTHNRGSTHRYTEWNAAFIQFIKVHFSD